MATVAIMHQLSVYQSMFYMIIGGELGCVEKDGADYGRLDSLVKTFDAPMLVYIFDVPSQGVRFTFRGLHSDFQKIRGVR